MVEDTVFLLDVDNTLLDNDSVLADFRRFLQETIGLEHSARYWQIYEALRAANGYADYLGALQCYRLENLDDLRLLTISAYFVDYPFAQRLYPGALAVLDYLRTLGPTVILSDGDGVFQPLKIQRCGLHAAVEGRVLIYIHKEQMLEAVARHYPARRYVMIDDKLRLLAAMQAQWAERLTTVFVRQGHYAADPEQTRPYPPADVTVDRIGDLLAYDFS